VDSLQNTNETIFKETSLVIENENEKSGTAKIEPKKTTTKKENKNQKKYHVVNKGESLNRIAHNYGISTKRLLKLNPKIKANHKLKIGTKLRVR
jgi:LysM repeat protein